MEGTMAEIRWFAADFAPKSWMYCQGQTLAVNTNQALFSLLGTTYGGNGSTTFNLPNFSGRIAVGTGGNYNLGQFAGHNQITLTTLNMPAHTHAVPPAALKLSTNNGASDTPFQGSTLGVFNDASGGGGTPNNAYNNATPDITLNSGSLNVAIAGNGLPLNITQPGLGMNYVICIYGIYPSRS